MGKPIVKWMGFYGKGEDKKNQMQVEVSGKTYLQNLWTGAWEVYVVCQNLRSHKTGYWRKVTSARVISALNMYVEEAVADGTIVR